MSKIINATLLATAGTAFNAAFMRGLGQAETQYQSIATTITSTTKRNEYGWLGKFPSMRRWASYRVIEQFKAHKYSIENESFESTIPVDRDDLEDDELGMYGALFEEMGQAAAAHPDELVWQLWQAAFDTPCYDGQNFFDTDHPVLDAEGAKYSVSNMQAGAGPAWYLIDDTRALKPVIYQERKKTQFVALDKPDDPNVFLRKEFLYGVDNRCNVGLAFWQFAFGSKAALDGDNYGAARSAMRNLRGDRGRKMGVRPKLLLVPPSLEKKGLQLINATNDAAGASNVWQNTSRLMVADWLDG